MARVSLYVASVVFLVLCVLDQSGLQLYRGSYLAPFAFLASMLFIAADMNKSLCEYRPLALKMRLKGTRRRKRARRVARRS